MVVTDYRRFVFRIIINGARRDFHAVNRPFTVGVLIRNSRQRADCFPIFHVSRFHTVEGQGIKCLVFRNSGFVTAIRIQITACNLLAVNRPIVIARKRRQFHSLIRRIILNEIFLRSEDQLVNTDYIIPCRARLMRFYQEIQAACSTFQGECKFVFRPYSFGRYVRLKNIRIAKSMSAYFITKIYPKRVLHAKFKGIFPCGKCRSGKTYPRRCAICRIGRACRKGQHAVCNRARSIRNRAERTRGHAINHVGVLEGKRVRLYGYSRFVFHIIINRFRGNDFTVNRPEIAVRKRREFPDCVTADHRFRFESLIFCKDKII